MSILSFFIDAINNAIVVLNTIVLLLLLIHLLNKKKMNILFHFHEHLTDVALSGLLRS